MILATPRITHHLHSIPPPGPGHRRTRRLLSTAHAAVRPDDATTEAAGEGTSSSSPSSESLRAAKPAATTMAPAPAAFSLPKDYSHTLFHSECLEVLGLVDLESLRKRPRLTVGVTVKASVVLPVLVVLAVLYLTDVAKGVVDWTHHHLESEDVGD
ncbi:uncharacterized protein LOC110431294 [Sorghum bicolor]|uniref:uncharacterized protein LOC110431294 n=1 Tax=Sorghum bicolor TaxID=4558 RepID=UPI0007F1D20B|nr:uncharacterized protein LOC110431294 [Sorghum bicolor]|eukprot:XP_021305949.1 uncharacterized protein LOC110431294 [Sorghum bicolor]